MIVRFLWNELATVAVKTSALVFLSMKSVRDIFSDQPLNTDTRIIQTLWHVSLVSMLTRFNCPSFIFLVPLQSFASKIFSHWQTGETTSKLFPFVWETWIILTRNRLLVDIFLTRRLSKSLAFCEFASVNFEP